MADDYGFEIQEGQYWSHNLEILLHKMLLSNHSSVLVGY